MKKSVASPVVWLIALNVIAVVIFGGRYLHSLAQEHQRRHEDDVTAAQILTQASGMSLVDSRRLMYLSDDLQRGGAISDDDLNWCLTLLKGSGAYSLNSLSQRQEVDLTLLQGLPAMSPAQKQRLYPAMIAQLALDSPQDEVGVDVTGPSAILGKIGDRRAITVLESHLEDRRPMIHQIVVEALERFGVNKAS